MPTDTNRPADEQGQDAQTTIAELESEMPLKPLLEETLPHDSLELMTQTQKKGPGRGWWGPQKGGTHTPAGPAGPDKGAGGTGGGAGDVSASKIKDNPHVKDYIGSGKNVKSTDGKNDWSTYSNHEQTFSSGRKHSITVYHVSKDNTYSARVIGKVKGQASESTWGQGNGSTAGKAIKSAIDKAVQRKGDKFPKVVDIID